jgi:hypothetical protein
MSLTPPEHAEIVEGALTPANVLHYRLRSILDGADPDLAGYFGRGWTQYVGLKQLSEAVVKLGEQLTILAQKVDELAAGGVTHEQLVAAMTDPAVLAAMRQAAFEGAQRAESE